MTDTARYADVVLPATTFLEHQRGAPRLRHDADARRAGRRARRRGAVEQQRVRRARRRGSGSLPPASPPSRRALVEPRAGGRARRQLRRRDVSRARGIRRAHHVGARPIEPRSTVRRAIPTRASHLVPVHLAHEARRSPTRTGRIRAATRVPARAHLAGTATRSARRSASSATRRALLEMQPARRRAARPRRRPTVVACRTRAARSVAGCASLARVREPASACSPRACGGATPERLHRERAAPGRARRSRGRAAFNDARVEVTPA